MLMMLCCISNQGEGTLCQTAQTLQQLEGNDLQIPQKKKQISNIPPFFFFKSQVACLVSLVYTDVRLIDYV